MRAAAPRAVRKIRLAAVPHDLAACARIPRKAVSGQTGTGPAHQAVNVAVDVPKDNNVVPAASADGNRLPNSSVRPTFTSQPLGFR
jgi:hypothetical protein